MSLDLSAIPGGLPLTLAADFTLESSEVEKGRAAIDAMLEGCKSSDERRASEEALDTLALVLSTGACDAQTFPWHQVRAHHGQAALNLLKEDGAPGSLEALRCRLDPNRKYRQISTIYNAKLIQKHRNTLRKVLKECKGLGYMSEEEWERAVSPNKARTPTARRIVTYGEFRAVVRASIASSNVAGLRDSLIFYCFYHGELKLSELLTVMVEGLSFDQTTRQVSIRIGKSKSAAARLISLPNEALIILEDWLEQRGSDDGPLFNPVKKNHRVEIKRLSGAEIREICDKRSLEAGVWQFTPDDLRKSTQAQIKLSQENGYVFVPAPIETSALFAGLDAADSLDEEPEPAPIAKVCFPYWENQAGT